MYTKKIYACALLTMLMPCLYATKEKPEVFQELTITTETEQYLIPLSNQRELELMIRWMDERRLEIQVPEYIGEQIQNNTTNQVNHLNQINRNNHHNSPASVLQLGFFVIPQNDDDEYVSSSDTEEQENEEWESDEEGDGIRVFSQNLDT